MSHTYPLTPNHPPPRSKFKPFIPHVAKTAIDAIKAQQKDDEWAGWGDGWVWSEGLSSSPNLGGMPLCR